MMRFFLILLMFLSGCTFGVRIESCPPEDAATVDPKGRYTEVPKGWYDVDKNWWPDVQDDSKAGESIFDEEVP